MQTSAGQQLQVVPDHIMADEAPELQVCGLEPYEHIALRADLVDGAGQPVEFRSGFCRRPLRLS